MDHAHLSRIRAYRCQSPTAFCYHYRERVTLALSLFIMPGLPWGLGALSLICCLHGRELVPSPGIIAFTSRLQIYPPPPSAGEATQRLGHVRQAFYH
jgi:hypothetical protein